MDNILTRLPVRTLMRCGCVSKLWYKSIHHDPYFATSHSLHSQKNPTLMFHLLNIEHHTCRYKHYNHFFYSSSSGSEGKNVDGDGVAGNGVNYLLLRTPYLLCRSARRELIGHCNGLVCLSLTDIKPGIIEIINPSRFEVLNIFCPVFHGRTISYGFGFDSLTKEYKVVLIVLNGHGRVAGMSIRYMCLAFTLGTNSWRGVSTPHSHQVNITTDYFEFDLATAAFFCGGSLFWKRIRKPNNKLLSFDLHNETFQFIQLPPVDECFPITNKQILSWCYLLEYPEAGSLCAARLYKILPPTDEEVSELHHDVHVHLHILKDKLKQVWIKQETFDLVSSLLPPCFYDSITTCRMMSFSGRILLYWFDRMQLQFYDLHSQHLKVGKPNSQNDIVQAFGSKRPIPTYNQLNCHMEDFKHYQLNSHMENFVSLRTFLPEEAYRTDRRIELEDLLYFMMIGTRSPGGGCLCLPRKSYVFY